MAVAFRPEEQWFTPPTAARVDTNSATWPVFVDEDIVPIAVAFRPDEQDANPPIVVNNLVIAGWPSFVDEDAVPVTPPFRPEEQDFTPPTASKIDFSVSPVFVTDDIVPFVAATPSVEQPAIRVGANSLR